MSTTATAEETLRQLQLALYGSTDVLLTMDDPTFGIECTIHRGVQHATVTNQPDPISAILNAFFLVKNGTTPPPAKEAYTIAVRQRPTFWKRWPLRLIGVGLLLASDRPWRTLVAYWGRYWNLGVFLMSMAYPPTAEVRDV